MSTVKKRNSGDEGGGIVLRDVEQITCAHAMSTLLELRLRSLPGDTMKDLVSLIPEFRECSPDSEEFQELSQTIRELLFPELVGGLVEQPCAADSEILQKRMDFIGGRIKEKRKALNMNQEELAEKSGLPQSHISRIESGVHSPSYRTLEKIAKALDTTVGDLDPSL